MKDIDKIFNKYEYRLEELPIPTFVSTPNKNGGSYIKNGRMLHKGARMSWENKKKTIGNVVNYW
jgi:nitric oxide synthase oxygenase domain/subunit